MQVKHILTPIDFSENSDKAVAFAAKLAESLSATLHVVHIYQLPMYVVPDGGFVMGDELGSKLKAASEEAVNRFISERGFYGVTMKAHVLCGLPHEAILRIADELDVDMIIMGTHGRAKLSRVLLGSVAEKVVRTSNVPVIVVPNEA
ncbi:MAG: universal stress protein [Myxococcales bacterium]|nr:MAG: universal stress protein [Myxococcales bacterium]